MPKAKGYPRRTCVVCGKSTDHWIAVARYVFRDNEMVEKDFFLCRGCNKKLEFWQRRAEAMIVTIFLVSQGVDLTKLPDGHCRK